MLSINELEHWLQDQECKGTRIVYHKGHLSKDRLKYEVIDGVMKIVTMEPLHSIAQMLADLCEQGKVLLFQKRIGPHAWDYIAQRRK